MEVTFLGSGTSQGVPVIACNCKVCLSDNWKDKRLRSSIWVKVENTSLVIDTGPDFRQQMLANGIKKLDAVLFTHEHKDHTAGLDDIRAYNFTQKKAMDVYATLRVQGALKKEFSYIFDNSQYPGIPQLALHDIDLRPFLVNEIEVIPIEVMHYKLPVLGFRIGDFTYITDANFIAEEEKQKIKGTKVLILNALRKQEHVSHFTLSQALELIEELQPERSYLTHISHLLGLHDEIQSELPKHVQLAYDGLQLSV